MLGPLLRAAPAGMVMVVICARECVPPLLFLMCSRSSACCNPAWGVSFLSSCVHVLLTRSLPFSSFCLCSIKGGVWRHHVQGGVVLREWVGFCSDMLSSQLAIFVHLLGC